MYRRTATIEMLDLLIGGKGEKKGFGSGTAHPLLRIIPKHVQRSQSSDSKVIESGKELLVKKLR
jgi:hypothetical protein